MAKQSDRNARTFWIAVGCIGCIGFSYAIGFSFGFSLGAKFSGEGVTMSNFNQVILMGNFTRDPQLSYTPNQTPVVEFGLAVNRKWTMQDDSQGEEVLFIECQVYGKRAEVISRYFVKGSPIFVQGRLKQERWDKDGTTHSRIRVMVENFEFIGRKESENERNGM